MLGTATGMISVLCQLYIASVSDSSTNKRTRRPASEFTPAYYPTTSSCESTRTTPYSIFIVAKQ